jgi:hypothetical protein
MMQIVPTIIALIILLSIFMILLVFPEVLQVLTILSGGLVLLIFVGGYLANKD